jgi:formate transporter
MTCAQNNACLTSADSAAGKDENAREEVRAPAAIAVAAEALGAKKAAYDGSTLFVLAILGGAFISLGGLFAIVALAGADGQLPWGLAHVLGGTVFSLGLVLILIGGGQLFTGDCLMVMTWASGKLKFGALMRVWVVVWFGNLLGAVATALLIFLSGEYRFGHGAVGATALQYATLKAGLPPREAFFLAILCNVLVCLAVWLSLASRTVAGKVVAIIFPVAAFVAAGFEHCVADMFFVPLGLMIVHWAPAGFWTDLGHGTAMAPPVIAVSAFLRNLMIVTAGNWVGGACFVGAPYWFAYRRRHASGDGTLTAQH